MVLGVWLSAYGFGRIVWTYDFGGTVLQMTAGQAQKSKLILNRKINDSQNLYIQMHAQLLPAFTQLNEHPP